MGTVKTAQEILPQYHYVLGTLRKEDGASIFHQRRNQRPPERPYAENVYYYAIYSALGDVTLTVTTYMTLKKMKVKIVRLRNETQQRLFLDTKTKMWVWMKHRNYITFYGRGKGKNLGWSTESTTVKETSRRHRSTYCVPLRSSWRRNMTRYK